jgi:hypothetical protein
MAWCDTSENRIACCDVGLVATGVGDACGCPEGGPLMAKAVAAGCKLPPDARPITPYAIQDIVRQKEADFQGCYKAASLDPRRPTVQVVLGLELSPDGRVFAARIEASTQPSSGAEACVLGVAKALRFPPPPAKVMRFVHPLTVTVPAAGAGPQPGAAPLTAPSALAP